MGVLLTLSLCCGVGTAVAGQCRDPWVTRAVQQVTGRQPNGSGDNGECNIYRYGGGHWTSYDDLVSKVKFAFGLGPAPGSGNAYYAQGQCKDPWVTKAVFQVTGRPVRGSGDNGECNIYRYGGGHWSDYNDLVSKVRVAFGQSLPNLAPNSSDFTTANLLRNAPQLSSLPATYLRGTNIKVYRYQGRWYQVIAQGGGNLVAQGGGNVVSHDGGTVIAQGGGNFYVMKLISQDGASLVSTNGGN